MKVKRLFASLLLGLGLAILFLSASKAAPDTCAALQSKAGGAGRGSILRPANPILHPPANSHTVPLTTTISITYDEPISPTSVSPGTFAVHAMQTGQLLQTYGVYSGTIRLTPTQFLHPGEWVQVCATTGTLSLVDGQGPISPTVWDFWATVGGGSGLFADSGQRLAYSLNADVGLGDLDGDGDLDAFIANWDTANQVWLNDGMGVFTDTGQSLGDEASTAVALADLDGDGDLDALVANTNYEPNKVWLNDGSATFSDGGQSLGAGASEGLALGDVDGDGDLDAFVANSGPNQVWLNDGAGIFVDSGQNLDNAFTWGVDLGDLDGDGDLDALVANSGSNKVWRNDGAGVFSDSGQTLGNSASWELALGDLDSDGDLDALVANYDDDAGQPNRVWLNDGAGGFTDTGQALGNSASWDLALGDLDGDGDLDAFVANEYAQEVQPDRAWLNDGTGFFASNGQSLGHTVSHGVALGDLDGDGDLDAFVAIEPLYPDSGSRVWLNGITQADLGLAKSVTPPLVAPGQAMTYTLAYTNLGPGRASGVVISDVVPITLTQLSFSFGGAAITPTGDLSYTWQVADLEAGQGGLITVTGEVSPAVSGLFELINQAAITATVIDTDTRNNTATASNLVDAEPPGPPTLLSPPNWTVTSTNSLTLTWAPSPSPDVAGYWLLLDWGFMDVGNVTQYNTGVLPELTHAWTLAAYDLVGNVGLYTDTWYFVIEDAPPEPPTLLGPPDDTLTSTPSLTLTWAPSPSPDVAGYLVNLGGAVSDVGDVTQHPTPLLADGTYTWTAAAYDLDANTGPYTDVWSFEVDATPPEILGLAPGQGETEVTIDAPVVLTFSEPIVTGTFGYQVAPDPGAWSATWGDGDTGVRLDHAPFAYQTRYTVTVDGADDRAGNPLLGVPVTWSFATAAQPCTQVTGVDLALVTTGTLSPGDLIEFQADVSPDDSSLPYHYGVDYGDGTVVTRTDSLDPLALSHTYAASGTYTAQVAVWNCGADAAESVRDSVAVTITGEPICTPVSGVTLSYTNTGTLYTGDRVYFQADLSPDEADKPYTYTVYLDAQTLIYPQSSSQDPLGFDYTFSSAGTYTVEVQVWNCDAGEADAVVDAVRVTVRPVAVGYTVYLPIVIGQD